MLMTPGLKVRPWSWLQSRLFIQQRSRLLDRAISVALEPLESRILLAATPTRVLTAGNADATDLAIFAELDGNAFYTTGFGVNGLYVTDGLTSTRISTSTVNYDQTMTGPGSAILNNQLYLSLNNQLWRTNGSSATTTQVSNISGLQDIQGLTTVGSRLFFTGVTAATGRELYVSDGTQDGTVRVLDLIPGTSTNTFSRVVSFNGSAYFLTWGWSGAGLYRSDGTAAGTTLVASVLGNTNPVATGEGIYFLANTAADGRELWRSDGTAAGTALLRDLSTGTASTEPVSFTTTANRLFMVVNANDVRSLYTSDGTSAGTTLLHSNGTRRIAPLVTVGNEIYYSVSSLADSTAAVDIYRTNGVSTTLVKSFPVAGTFEGVQPRGFVTAGGLVYFSAWESATNTEVYRTDGTPAGTVLAANIDQTYGSDPDWFVASNGSIYFRADDGTNQGLYVVPPDSAAQMPTSLSITPIDSARATVTWTHATGDHSGFTLQRARNSTFTTGLTTYTLPGSLRSFTDTGLTGLTTFYYRIQAYNPTGASSALNQTVVMAMPPVPGSFSAPTAGRTSNSLQLTWGVVPGETGFRLERSSTSNFSVVDFAVDLAANVSQYVNTGLAQNTTHYYRLRSYNSSGVSAWTNTLTATTTLPAPTAPTALNAVVLSDTQVALTWENTSTTATGFDLERSLDAAFSATVTLAVSGLATNFTDTFLSPNTTYHYRVRAKNSGGPSSWITTSVYVTQVPPAAPTNVKLTPLSRTSMSISWEDKSINETAFSIERREGSSGDWIEVQRTAANTTGVIDSTTLGGTGYYYRIRAENPVGVSDYTAPAYEVTPSNAHYLLKDINEETVTSDTNNIVVIDNRAYYTARKTFGNSATSLFMSDGSVGSAIELTNKIGDYGASKGFAFKGQYYFFGDSSQTTLYRVNPTSPSDPILVGSAGGLSQPTQPVIAGDRFFFWNSKRLYVSDGLTGVTQLAAFTNDVQNNLWVSGQHVFFLTMQGGAWQIWKSDGTVSGTAAFASFFPSEMAVVGDRLFFIRNANGQAELWVTPTVSAAPQLLLSVAYPTTLVAGLATYNNKAYFTTRGSLAADPGTIWESDGTTVGTKVAAQPNVPIENGRLYQLGNSLYFFSSGASVYASDGTTVGTVKVINNQPMASPVFTATADGNAYFAGADANNSSNYTLYRSNGTVAGTGTVASLTISYQNNKLVAASDRVYFTGWSYPEYDGLWVSDGSAAGTHLTKDITPLPNYGSAPSEPVLYKGEAYFTAYDHRTWKRGLYKTDGTPAGTRLVFDGVSIGKSTDEEIKLTIAGDLLYFNVPSTYNSELWASDGTAVGTRRVFAAANNMAQGAQILASHQGYLYFSSGNNSTADGQIWRTDGTLAGTTPVADLVSNGNENISYTASTGDKLILFSTSARATANTQPTTWYVYALDGQNITLLTALNYGNASTALSPPVQHGNLVYFAAYDTVNGRELWRTDGTVAGTVRLSDFLPGNQSGALGYLTAWDGGVIMSAYTEVDGIKAQRVVVSDGTVAGTKIIATVDTVSWSFAPALGGVFFNGSLPGFGEELCFTDGTAAGTRVVRNIRSGANPSGPREILAVGEGVMFTAMSDNGIRQLWFSDGSLAGTFRLTSDAAVDGSEIFQIALNNRYIFANTMGTQRGIEMWAIGAPAAPVATPVMAAPPLSLSTFAAATALTVSTVYPIQISWRSGYGNDDVYFVECADNAAFNNARVYVVPPQDGANQIYTDHVTALQTQYYRIRARNSFGYSSYSQTITARANAAPEAADDSASTPQNTPVLINVKLNDNDTDSDPLTIVLLTLPANGVATIQNGQILYTPNAGYFGSDAFTYRLNDGQADSNEATVRISVIDNTRPTVTGIAINNGNAQRSMLTTFALTFSEEVTLTSDAIALRTTAGATVNGVSLQITNPTGDNRNFVVTFSGSAVIGGSLADGVYDLIINAAGVTDRVGNTLASNVTRRTHRLFGDFNGDAIVNTVDMSRFRAALGSTHGSINYQAYFDYDNNGLINSFDNTEFNKRYGKRLTV